MYKKIITFFSLFIIFLIISFSLLIFIRFENYIDTLMFNNDLKTIIIVDKKDYQSMKNHDVIDFILDDVTYTSQIDNIYSNKNNYYLTLNKFIDINENQTKIIKLKLSNQNIFGF